MCAIKDVHRILNLLPRRNNTKNNSVYGLLDIGPGVGKTMKRLPGLKERQEKRNRKKKRRKRLDQKDVLALKSATCNGERHHHGNRPYLQPLWVSVIEHNADAPRDSPRPAFTTQEYPSNLSVQALSRKPSLPGKFNTRFYRCPVGVDSRVV